ncbi:hypothetical protein [Spongiactinospora sp. TRM90649]|uniref:hypothetical protein n=1 Tax=Spongiactinospora sp. TRM90649 TaxID=3031114 RepID=UPI0023F85BE1|nr:hypothetical protein [Spongiactinospora sp. TRM90649]MDF5759192.1 hypothetical protein [Spongiactinospora sp. TRM90649]
MNELALTESPSLRAACAGQVEVLAEIDPVTLLADGTHVSTGMVAAYFGVGIEAIKSLIKDNRPELEANEYRVISGDELRSFKDLSGAGPRARSFALFTERTVLLVAMLLRDSAKARAIRTRLLDRAQGKDAPAVREPSRRELAQWVIEAEERAELEAARADKAEHRAETAEKKFAEFEGGPGITLTKFHKKYFSEVSERRFFEHLYAKGYLIDQRGRGAWDERRQTHKDGPQHFEPSYRGKPFLYLHEAGIYGGKRRFKTLVRPGDPELSFKAQLVAEGLTGNQHIVNPLFALSK